MKTMKHFVRTRILGAAAFATVCLVSTVALAATVNAIYNSDTDVPVTTGSYTATGKTVNFTLNFAPATGTELMVVKNTGLAFINGTFDNLTNGQKVALSYGGITYSFVANYYGGSGNDLVLVWANNRAFAWGYDNVGQVGDNTSGTNRLMPVPVTATGVLAGKTVMAIAAGSSHSLALCSDGTVAAWGDNLYGQLGDNSTTRRLAPVAVNTASGVSALYGKTVVAIAAGYAHSLALCLDGTVAAWGDNRYAELGDNYVSGAESHVPMAVNTTSGVSALYGKTVVAIAAGSLHSLALCSDGTVATWGWNYTGQLGDNSAADRFVPIMVNTAPGVSALYGKMVVAIAAGYGHSLALCSDGTVAAWGDNVFGQLGDNTTTQRNTPVAVNTAPGSALYGNSVTAIAVGKWHSLALRSDGTVVAWGNNYSGRLGDNTTTERHMPVAVNAVLGVSALYGKTVLDIVAGRQHSVALCSDGTVAAWGSNGDGEVGDNSTAQRNAPVAVSSSPLGAGERFTHVFCGPEATHSLALVAGPANPTVVVADYSAASDVPVTSNNYTATGNTVNFTLNFAPDTGTELMVVKNTGLAFINGTFDNLAQGQTVALSYGGTTYNFVANYYGGSGNDLMLVWARNRALAWGDNVVGQLGDNTTTNRLLPVSVITTGVLAGKTVLATAAGAGHSLALCSDGAVAAWGYNRDGQLGDNTGGYLGAQKLAPVAVNVASNVSALFGKTVVAVEACQNHSLALCSDGTVAAWGRNGFGQLGDNTTANRLVPVAVKTNSGVSALFSKTVVAIAGGYGHSLALCSDGTVAAWGANVYGQLGDNTTTDRHVPVPVSTSLGVSALNGKTVVAIAAGFAHSLALCSDGTVVAWGDNYEGQLGDNGAESYSLVPVMVNTASSVSALYGKTVLAISVGGHHSLALCADGTAAAWGENLDGQLGDNTTTRRLAPVAMNTASGVSALYGKTVVAIATGSAHSLALCLDGTMTAWGYNYSGQLGDSTTTQRNAPVAVNSSPLAAGERFTRVFRGSMADHTLALVAGPATPTVVVAAYNAATDVPVTSSIYTATSKTVNFTLNFAPATGTELTVVKNIGLAFINGTFDNLTNGQQVALSYDGITYNFVANYYGGSGNDLVLVWANNRAFAWGDNSSGQLGDNTSGTNRLLPVPVIATGVLAGKSVVATAPSGGHSLALCSDGTVAAWGNNFSGQLGDNTTEDYLLPAAVNMASGVSALYGQTVVALAAGAWHSLALCSDGTVAAWGDNGYGQLGDDTTTEHHVPVAVSTAPSSALYGKTVVAIAAGMFHSLALCSDGTVAAWGNNYSGQLGDGTGSYEVQSLVPVAVNTASGVSSLYGKTVVTVAAGAWHSLALCSDGTVAAWGNNGDGQLGDNTDTYPPYRTVPVAVNTELGVSALYGKTVVAIGAGASYSVALCSDGAVATWGDNVSGELGDNTGGTPGAGSLVPVAVNTTPGVSALYGKTAVAIAAGAHHCLAFCSDGTVAGWGWNNSGQIGDNTETQRNAPVPLNSTPLATGERVVRTFSGPIAWHTLAVVAAPSATDFTLTDIKKLDEGSFQFAFTNRPAALFSVLATTNLSLPLNHWTVLHGIAEISPGQFQFTDSQATNCPQRFYRVRSP